jgi:hypothetical protein
MRHIRTTPTAPSATTRRRRAATSIVLAVAVAVIVAAATVDQPAAAVDDPVPNDASAPVPATAPVAAPTTVAPGDPDAGEPSDDAATPTSTPPATTTPSSVPPQVTVPDPDTTVPPAPAARNIPVFPSQIANILATIRYVESRGDYSAPPNRGNASGAYQFIASTWNGYGGYPHAYLAPPEVQDERAALDVDKFLARFDNDVSMIPVMWYYPRAAIEPALMDIVPVPSAGNILTVREYQQRWLGVWAFLSGQKIPPTLTLAAALARLGLPPDLPPPQPVDPSVPAIERKATISFPVLGPTRIAAPSCGDADGTADNAGADATPEEIEAAGLCAEEAPGIVFGVKLQPVLSVADGVVTDVVDRPGEPVSVTVTDTTGRSYRLEGFNDDNPGTDDGAAPPHLRLTALSRVGTSVRAGQVLGFMGDSSPLPLGIRSDVPTDRTVVIAADAVAPHIRLTIRDLDGTPVDAYGPVIDALFRQVCSIGTGPWSSPPNGADHTPVVTETTDDDRLIDSEWVITETGQVHATGWAAMIYPSEGCDYAPKDTRGPGAGGAPDVPADWYEPIDLPTSMWIDLVTADDDLDPPLLRR